MKENFYQNRLAFLQKSSIRENKIEEMNNRIAEFGVRLILDKQKNSLDYQSLSQKYGQGATAFQNLRNQMPERLAHLSYKKFYGYLIGDLTADLSKTIFDYADFSHFLTAFEDDDLNSHPRGARAVSKSKLYSI